MFNTQILAGSSGQGGETQQSLKFNDDESQYLSWTPAAAGNRKTWTWSGWVKLGNISIDRDIFTAAGSGTQLFECMITSGNTIQVYTNSQVVLNSTQVLRDTSAWYHLMYVSDTTQATASDRFKIYLNGVEITAFATDNRSGYSQNFDGGINSTVAHYIGQNQVSGNRFDGYMSDINFIDGQALDPTSFGQFTNGYWEKIDYSGSYGTNGFHLTFQDDVVSEGFNAVTYRGTGATQSISGLGFAPDLVWTKARDITYSNLLVDSVRGVTKELRANGTNAEATNSGVTSFDADGYTLGSYDDYNRSVNTFVAWCWDAGSGSAASNTDGSITSTVKANPSYGFSIASWTGNATAGATVGHGLSSTPEMIITKNRNNGSEYWSVYHKDVGNTAALFLNSTGTPFTSSAYWNNTSPTSSVFSIGSNPVINESGSGIIAYCFNSVAGYSYISSYSGTGSNGHKITTGFSPAFIMLKRYDSGSVEDWLIYDNTRNPVNLSGNEYVLRPNTSGAEQAYGSIDFESDGFTLQTVGGALNASGGDYIVMAFADTREAAFWKDASGQGNHWTPNNLDYRDSLIDSPANNFGTFNPVSKALYQPTFSNGNLSLSATTAWSGAVGAIGVTSGKWYWEVINGDADSFVGICADDLVFSVQDPQILTGTILYYGGGYKRIDGALTSYGTAYSTETIGVALDIDGGTITFYKNNVSQGSISLSSSTLNGKTILPYFTKYGSTMIANFGQDSTFAGATTAGGNQDDNGIGDFAYAPPSGYLALCTANLPTPSIVDGSTAFSTVLYTGNNSTQSITGVGFQPDWVWLKSRTTGYDHTVYDVIRGATYKLPTNDTYAESADVDTLTSFDSDGFSVGADVKVNAASGAMVSWNWKAGGTAVSNTAGSITSQVSANVDAGFSIASYSGTGSAASFGHGLATEPSMVIVKGRNVAVDWVVYHKDLGKDKFLYLNGTNAVGTISNYWGAGGVTNSVVGLNTYSGNNGSYDYIAYCFANSDIIKAGSYTGNGSADGPFVYTGGRVQWLMIKRTDSAHSWYIFDDVRTPTNPQGYNIMANSSNAEDGPTNIPLDFLSNGFKPRGTGGSQNASGGSYIYLAIMESPLKHSNAR